LQAEGLPNAIADPFQLHLYIGGEEVVFVTGKGCVLKDPGTVFDLKAHRIGVDEPPVSILEVLIILPVQIGVVVFVILETRGVDFVPFVKYSAGTQYPGVDDMADLMVEISFLLSQYAEGNIGVAVQQVLDTAGRGKCSVFRITVDIPHQNDGQFFRGETVGCQREEVIRELGHEVCQKSDGLIVGLGGKLCFKGVILRC